MGGKSSKQTTENKPPAWSAPLFSKSAGMASHLYDSGAGGQTYRGATVPGLSGTTMSGVNQLAQAGANWNTAGTRPLYQGLGEAALTQDAGTLEDYASGKFLNGEGNPFYRQRLEKEIGDSNALINSAFSGAGRYGSPGAHQSVIADNTSNMLLQGLETDYNRQQDNQFAAMGLRGQALDRATGAADRMAGLDQQNFQNRLTGAGATLQAGGILDEQAQKQLSDEVAKWYAIDNQDWTRLGLLQAAAAGSAGNYGTQVATARQPVGIGGIMSGFGSLLGKSDARLKENIEPVGYRNGHVLWEFTYRGSPEKFRGVMAQFVMDTQPEAVVTMPDGFMAVDYAQLGFPMERVN